MNITIYGWSISPRDDPAPFHGDRARFEVAACFIAVGA
jgi:hypothetical protein